MCEKPPTTDNRLQVRLGAGDLAVEAPDGTALRLDAEGRWGSFRPGPALHRRTLDGKVVVHEGAALRALDPDEADAVHLAVGRFARALADRVERGALPLELHGSAGGRAALLDRLRAVADWSPARYRGEAERFAAAYPEPVFILPPDRYLDVVVLPAVGCPHGRCAFCAFYRERGFRILDDAEFAAHLEAVRRFFGRAIRARNGVFLGSASALSLPQPALMRGLESVKRTLGPMPRGIAAFHDPDHAPTRRAEDHAELRAAGLRTVTVGLETGLAALREKLGKRPRLDRVHAAVAAQVEAGLTCGVTILVGAGGPATADDHRRATVEAVRRMPLRARDMVYLSPLAETLTAAGMAREYGRFRLELARSTRAKIVPYRIERYHLFA